MYVYIYIYIYISKATANNNNKKVIFENYAPFADCISEINNTPVDNAEYINAVIVMYNLMEYSNNYLKGSRSL